ncbi:TetR/AcrR family transcriptional regulator C-terminal domain-containing protein [Streptomyces sp. NRRL S-118]|uniref:TetR/AcrR family transcriptional regulator C-terminal domain-containing protein n=1 Tax=Streptomyces sp. NRRL S-118 TaxID=1463881 RepID=UPI0004CADD87|nr:TetR/AcrR family transcriptional regulator C-terminal domain-containing protein [Streptomyces sp. NRRL S-118]
MTELSEPPYLRIAADIRRRIATGELAPGDRVPSTRRLAQDWGVALATATKALTTLRLEGAVEARPRIGTVVARPPQLPRPSPSPTAAARPPAGSPVRDQELSQERIVRAAIEIADAEGLAALSMRGVAARLGVAAMSPYRYVSSKDDLIALMADTAYGEAVHPAVPPAGWRARLEMGAEALWQVCRRHPWIAHIGPLGRPLVLPNLMAHGEWLLSALEGHGLDATTMFDVHLLIYSHVQGLAVHLERELQAQAATGLTDEEWMARQEASLRTIVASGRYPAVTRTLTGFPNGDYDLDLDALFRLGLRALLDGIAHIVEG